MADAPARLAAALADRYRIERELGQGGMATVYLAEDVKHQRKVALKVLRPELAAVLGAERFVQEITTTASLQHPHILPLFDSGSAGGFLYYVMPYVEGETLRDTLNREGQLGIEEAVQITTEVADALDYAHRQGVIHRDIKPENILLHDGRPVVADFGIALAVSAAAGGRMTETGLSLGTPHYMSPEQATADKDLTARSDVYSLGSVLYEMLTGEPPHMGTSAQQIIMKIVTDPVRPVTELRKSVPRHVAAATAKSLEKLPADRFASAKAFAAALGDPAFTHGVGAGAVPAAVPTSRARRYLPVAFALGGLALGILAGAALFRRGEAPAQVVRFHLEPPPGTELVELLRADVPIALSPDGSRIALVAAGPGQRSRIYLRGIDQVEALPLSGTEDAANPFFAPDGRSVGFVTVADGRLRRVGVEGGGVTTITDQASLLYSTPSWGDDGYVVFVGADYRLYRASGAGGRSQMLADVVRSGAAGQPALDTALVYPAVLPGGRSVIVSVCPAGIVRAAGVCPGALQLLDVATGSRTPLGVDAFRGWHMNGHLVFSDDGALFAVELDPARATVHGDPVAVFGGLGATGLLQRDRVALSRSGSIAYIPAADASDRVIVQVDRGGREQVLVAEPGGYEWVRWSPDETRISMVTRATGSQQVHVHDRRSGTTSLLTHAGMNHRPSWSPDGRFLAFTSRRGGMSDVWTVPADGSGPGGPIAPGKDVVQMSATFWTRDGEWIVIDGAADEGGSAGSDDIYALPASGNGPMRTVVSTPAGEQTGEVSPDGRWIAYVSDDAGYYQVYVQPFLRPGGRTLVSAGPALEPAWASDRELVYSSVESNQLMLARLELGASVSVVRTPLFDRARYTAGTASWRSYDVSRDGQRFLFTRSLSGEGTATPVVVLDWIAEVRRALAAQRASR